jgi:hypothetical protein
MWALENKTAYAAERSWTRDKNGVHLWLVALRATFEIDDRGLGLAEEQVPPPLAPEHHGEPGKSSLRLDSDLLYVKTSTDVVLDATAHAPHGRPSPVVPVSIRVSTLEKQLKVCGDRSYVQSGGALTISDPRPFERRPIRYEDAYGGADRADGDPRLHRVDTRNPVGRGVATGPARLIGRPAHSIEYLRGQASEAGPAGFGPIDPAWSPRLERAGTYDEAWQKTRRPLLAEDYQDLYGSSAPDDQRIAHLRGGEPVELTHLTPEGKLLFTLPKIYPVFTTFFGTQQREHRARITTLFIEPSKKRFALVWQTTLRVAAHEIEYLDRTLIREKRYL